jgi:hypothetical protein
VYRDSPYTLEILENEIRRVKIDTTERRWATASVPVFLALVPGFF